MVLFWSSRSSYSRSRNHHTDRFRRRDTKFDTVLASVRKDRNIQVRSNSVPYWRKTLESVRRKEEKGGLTHQKIEVSSPEITWQATGEAPLEMKG
jgi:hypothetical protein